jgi:hypothetical protein
LWAGCFGSDYSHYVRELAAAEDVDLSDKTLDQPFAGAASLPYQGERSLPSLIRADNLHAHWWTSPVFFAHLHRR